MITLELKKILDDSSFTDINIPYKMSQDEKLNLIGIANSYEAHWSGREIALRSNTLALYKLDTLELVNISPHLKYSINDFAFHPTNPYIAIAIGSYDGGYRFRGELIIWNYEKNEISSVLSDSRPNISTSREVINCEFNLDGTKLKFILKPTDNIDCEDFTYQTYEVSFPIESKILLDKINPILRTKYFETFNWQEKFQRLEDTKNGLIKISKDRHQIYKNRNLIWDMLFINQNLLVIARNEATIEIWNIETDTLQTIKLPEKGDCVEVFFNNSNNTLLVNLWKGFAEEKTPNILFSISLSNLKVKKIRECFHSISKSKHNDFLGRQTGLLGLKGKDFILSKDYNEVFQQHLGHFSPMNNYIRIDNSDLLYFLVTIRENFTSKRTICSINPIKFNIKKVLEFNDSFKHYWNLSGIIINKYLIISGTIFSQLKDDDMVKELFCIDLSTNKEKWNRIISSQVISFADFDNGEFAVALSNGQIEIIETETGKTIEIVIIKEKHSYAKPLSMKTCKTNLALGLTNGQLFVFNVKT